MLNLERSLAKQYIFYLSSFSYLVVQIKLLIHSDSIGTDNKCYYPKKINSIDLTFLESEKIFTEWM